MIWHDEASRFEQAGQLDPVDRCLCPDCLRVEGIHCDLITGGIQCQGECVRCERALSGGGEDGGDAVG